mmetsp:Transcript_80036/g.259275  ORF Transcript_80036/g.259275 Transcript_80036/m.259275 type:complete len:200 (+) Transcript_80036:1971-2570(+)
MRDVVAQDGVPAAVAIDDCQLAEGPRGLIGNHFALVAQTIVQVRHQGLLNRWVPLRHQDLSGISDQQTLCHGTLELALCDLGDLLVERQPVSLLQLVDQCKRMELDGAVLGVDGLLDLVDPSLHHIRGVLHQGDAADERGGRNERVLVHDRRLQVAVDLCCHGGVQDAAQHPDGVGTKAVILAVHVLDEALNDDEDFPL